MLLNYCLHEIEMPKKSSCLSTTIVYGQNWKLKILTLDIQKLLKGFFVLIEATQVIIKLIFVKSGIAQTTDSPPVFVRDAP